MRYMLNISDEEKQALLSQHSSPYNGYQTMQPRVPNLQPLKVYDAAGDKKGVQVTANGDVRTYSNVHLREGKEITCECGGMMYEGETCEQCGVKMESSVTEPHYGSFDYTENELGEEVYAGIQEPYGDIDFGAYDFDSKGPEQFDNDIKYSLDDKDDLSLELSADGMEMYPNEKPAYEFDSEGPLSTSGMFEDLDSPENIKESIKESLDWFKRFTKFN
jgi:hypothetical protein